MSSEPRFSVVIATYNRAAYVTQTVDSVLAQTETNFEVIVVDDGSVDDTRQAIAPYLDRVRYIFQDNQGMAGARNRGIREARGELVALLDSDDLWRPRYLEEMGKVFERHPEAGAVFVAERQIEEDGTPLPRVYTKRTEGVWFTPLGMITSDSWASGRPPVVRRVLLDELGAYDEGLCGAWDSELWIRLSFEVPMAVVPEPLVLKRVHGGNFSKDRVKDAEAWLEILKRIERDQPAFASKHVWALRRERAKNHLRIGGSLLARSAEERQLLPEARRHLVRVVWTYPLFLRAWSYLAISLFAPRAYESLHRLGSWMVKRMNLGPTRIPGSWRNRRRLGSA